MEKLLKYTYTLNSTGLKQELEKLWGRYQHILDNPNWEDLNEARGILYIIGYLFPEKIADEAIERRMHLLKEKIDINDFYVLVDSNSDDLNKKRKDPLFKKMENYYRVVKEFKNKTTKGKWYLDEERFVNLYNEYAPDESMRIGRFGEYDRKDD